jgi:hypothetical protein
MANDKKRAGDDAGIAADDSGCPTAPPQADPLLEVLHEDPSSLLTAELEGFVPAELREELRGIKEPLRDGWLQFHVAASSRRGASRLAQVRQFGVDSAAMSRFEAF